MQLSGTINRSDVVRVPECMCVFLALLMVICFAFEEKGCFPEEEGGKTN